MYNVMKHFVNKEKKIKLFTCKKTVKRCRTKYKWVGYNRIFPVSVIELRSIHCILNLLSNEREADR
jgi:hypothetical protein